MVLEEYSVLEFLGNIQIVRTGQRGEGGSAKLVLDRTRGRGVRPNHTYFYKARRALNKAFFPTNFQQPVKVLL